MPTCIITFKVPITTAADNKYCYIFSNFREKKGMIFHEKRLSADDSHEILCLKVFLKNQQNVKFSSASYRWRFIVLNSHCLLRLRCIDKLGSFMQTKYLCVLIHI